MRQRDGSMFLILKLMKENILSVRMNKEFRVYIAPTQFSGDHAFGLVTAFFDDIDEPLVVISPLAEDAPFKGEVTELFSLETFKVYIFDDQDRELLGYQATNPDHLKMLEAVRTAKFPPTNLSTLRQHITDISLWFANRKLSDDAAALRIKLNTPLYPEDLAITDYRSNANGYFGNSSPRMTMLDRQEPGRFQETDIVGQMSRVFPGRSIFHGPIRSDDGKECVDILVATTSNHIFIQAKDSPNTEASLKRSISRKKTTTLSHLGKATAQLSGAISYWKKNDFLQLLTPGLCHKITTDGRRLWGTIVVKELFDGEQFAYSRPVLDLARVCAVPCIVIDYRQLHEMTFHLRDEQSFVEAIETIYETGRESGQFPRLRFGLVSENGPSIPPNV